MERRIHLFIRFMKDFFSNLCFHLPFFFCSLLSPLLTLLTLSEMKIAGLFKQTVEMAQVPGAELHPKDRAIIERAAEARERLADRLHDIRVKDPGTERERGTFLFVDFFRAIYICSQWLFVRLFVCSFLFVCLFLANKLIV
jgi:hypothetical protein